MRKISKWTPEEASVLYWLIVWGLPSKEAVDLATPLIKTRSVDALVTMSSEIRKQISIMKGFKYSVPVGGSIPNLVRAASKIQPPKEIADLRPKDLTQVRFVPVNGHGELTKPISKPSPKFEQRPEDYTSPELTNSPLNSPSTVDVEKIIKNNPPRQLSQTTEPSIAQKLADKITPLIKQELSLEEILILAKKHGAKKVQWRDYIIKFI